MGKIDCLLQRIYSNPCNPVCCRPCRSSVACSNVWDGYQSNCGCNVGCGCDGNWSPTLVPSGESTPTNLGDPFKDDDLRAPPPVPSDARNSRKKGNTSLARLRVVNQEPTLARPPIEHQSSAVKIHLVDGDVQPMEEIATEVVQVSLQSSNTKPFPKNPLRDEK